MSVLTSYTPIGASRRPGPEQAYFFIMNSLLYSRMEAGFPSNDEGYDEDVNVYLAHLLSSLIYPGAGERFSATLGSTDASLAEAAAAADGARGRYRLYRAHADRILVSLGVFKNARGTRPSSVPHLSLARNVFIGRGKAYYAIARGYAAQAYRKNTAVGDVLGKLSDRFERYLGVLSFMGGEHFNIFRRLTDGEIFHLEQSAGAAGRREDVSVLYDRFLDVYSTYLRERTPETREALVSAAREMRTADPAFSFDIEEREKIRPL